MRLRRGRNDENLTILSLLITITTSQILFIINLIGIYNYKTPCPPDHLLDLGTPLTLETRMRLRKGVEVGGVPRGGPRSRRLGAISDRLIRRD